MQSFRSPCRILPAAFLAVHLAMALAVGIVRAQQPVHFTIGEDDLANVDVYSLHQSHDNILYAATDHGLYQYKHGSFSTIPSPAASHGSSLFNLKRDREGQLYCNNLSGQIFRLESDSLKLHYQAEPSTVASQFNFDFDADNNLLIASRNLSRLKADRNHLELLAKSPDGQGLFSIYRLPDGSLAVLLPRQDSLWISEGGQGFRKLAIPGSDSEGLAAWQAVGLQGRVMLLDVEGEVTEMQGNVPQQKHLRKTRERLMQWDETEFFGMDFSKGARSIGLENGALVEKESFFKDHFISAIACGPRGNLFFGTFGEGVFVVPNRQALRINTEMVDGQLRGICQGEKGEVFLTTRSGELFRYQDEMQLLFRQKDQALGRIYHFSGMDLGFDERYPGLIYDGPRITSSIKNAAPEGDSAVLISTSFWVSRFGPDPQNPAVWHSTSPGKQILAPFRERCYAAVYDPTGTALYIATSNQLRVVDPSGSFREITFAGESLNCNDLLWDDKRLIAATQRHGLLIFENDQVVKQYNRQSGLRDDFVTKMIRVGRKLYVGHQKGVQAIDLDDGKMQGFGLSEGVPPGSVRDMAVSEDRMWLLVGDALVSIGLADREKVAPVLDLIVDSVVVAGPGRVNTAQPGNFAHDQNRIEFNVDFRIIEFLDEAEFRYRLSGFDENWQTAPARERTIAYKSLPPGEFTFELKIVWRDLEGPAFVYAFEVMRPYWRQWWFYLLCAILLIALVGLGFGLRIRQIRKVSQQRLREQEMEMNLVESKLKALRSQMNPHFIFNSLNSIQDLILRQDTDQAYDYVVLFADLVRSTLKYSEQGYISIGAEIEFLNTYLSLEKLRFKDAFTYELRYEGSEDIEIPSMVVQPFIENALQHGLMHLSGQKRLDVSFELGEKLVCTITDNGIGRAEAQKIKDRQGGRHESFSLDAIRQRMEILSRGAVDQDGFTIEDLNENGRSSGTRVIVRMAYRRLF